MTAHTIIVWAVIERSLVCDCEVRECARRLLGRVFGDVLRGEAVVLFVVIGDNADRAQRIPEECAEFEIDDVVVGSTSTECFFHFITQEVLRIVAGRCRSG